MKYLETWRGMLSVCDGYVKTQTWQRRLSRLKSGGTRALTMARHRSQFCGS
jgi:hypothetical protein